MGARDSVGKIMLDLIRKKNPKLAEKIAAEAKKRLGGARSAD